MLKVENIIGRSDRAVANQFVIIDTDKNKVMFQSYESPIVEIDNNNNTITIYEDWDYSQTTGRYRNIFMDNEGFSCMNNKKGFEKAMKDGYAYYDYSSYDKIRYEVKVAA